MTEKPKRKLRARSYILYNFYSFLLLNSSTHQTSGHKNARKQTSGHKNARKQTSGHKNARKQTSARIISPPVFGSFRFLESEGGSNISFLKKR
jgi:hypothetical protein